ncbi:hypothetical protein GMMP15_490030 [Candidatus Magnetomoraceae bacterium gMMP-15]
MFKVYKNKNKLKISFSSMLKNIDDAAEETKKFLSECGHEKHEFNIILVMREALINATIHGNKHDEKKLVTYSLQYHNNKFSMKITDQGNGFDWQSILKKKSDINSENGRGLLIIKKYTKYFEYNKKGNKLKIKEILK